MFARQPTSWAKSRQPSRYRVIQYILNTPYKMSRSARYGVNEHVLNTLYKIFKSGNNQGQVLGKEYIHSVHAI
jgi:hypothetical protein